MKKHKEIGYELGNISFELLPGKSELWRKANYDTKEKIVNTTGLKAAKLVSEMILEEFPEEKIREQSLIMGDGNNEGKLGFIQGVNYVLNALKRNSVGVEFIVKNDDNIDEHIKDEIIKIINKKTV